MEMPFSDVCWLIEFITTSWETLISSLLTRPQSCLHTRLQQSNWGFCRIAPFGSRINNLILSKITRSCPILARFLLRAPCVRSQLWLGGASGTLEGTQCPGICLLVFLVWKDLAEGSCLLHVYFMEILAAETHFGDKTSKKAGVPGDRFIQKCMEKHPERYPRMNEAQRCILQQMSLVKPGFKAQLLEGT